MIEESVIIAELVQYFPEYKFSQGRRLYGKCIIAKNSTYSGAEIFIKKNKIVVDAAFPEMKTRILLGAGALLFKMFSIDYNEPSQRIYEFLNARYSSVKLGK